MTIREDFKDFHRFIRRGQVWSKKRYSVFGCPGAEEELTLCIKWDEAPGEFIVCARKQQAMLKRLGSKATRVAAEAVWHKKKTKDPLAESLARDLLWLPYETPFAMNSSRNQGYRGRTTDHWVYNRSSIQYMMESTIKKRHALRLNGIKTLEL